MMRQKLAAGARRNTLLYDCFPTPRTVFPALDSCFHFCSPLLSFLAHS